MSYSAADERARLPPPWGCQRCAHVEVTRYMVGGSGVVRWTCKEGLYMQAACTARVPTPFNAAVEPAPEAVASTNGLCHIQATEK